MIQNTIEGIERVATLGLLWRECKHWMAAQGMNFRLTSPGTGALDIRYESWATREEMLAIVRRRPQKNNLYGHVSSMKR
jgi:hypothetical protein